MDNVFRDYHGTILKVDDPILFVDRKTQKLKPGHVESFAYDSVILVNDSSKGQVTYKRFSKELVKVCQIKPVR